MEGINVTKIRCENIDLFDRSSKKNPYLESIIEKVPGITESKDEKTSI